MLDFSGNDEGRTYAKGHDRRDPYLHSPESIREAWREIHGGYRRPPGYVDYMLERELTGKDSKSVVTDEKLPGVVMELCMLDRLDWLSDERGWNVSYPISGNMQKGGYLVSSGRPGKRVEVYEYGNNRRGAIVDEFDAVANIEGEIALLEGKTKHSFNTGKIMRKESLFNELLVKGNGHDGPVCIVGMANDHRTKAGYNRAKFEYRGGNVWFLKGLQSHHIGMLASEYSARMSSMHD